MAVAEQQILVKAIFVLEVDVECAKCNVRLVCDINDRCGMISFLKKQLFSGSYNIV